MLRGGAAPIFLMFNPQLQLKSSPNIEQCHHNYSLLVCNMFIWCVINRMTLLFYRNIKLKQVQKNNKHGLCRLNNASININDNPKKMTIQRRLFTKGGVYQRPRDEGGGDGSCSLSYSIREVFILLVFFLLILCLSEVRQTHYIHG